MWKVVANMFFLHSKYLLRAAFSSRQLPISVINTWRWRLGGVTLCYSTISAMVYKSRCWEGCCFTEVGVLPREFLAEDKMLLLSC